MFNELFRTFKKKYFSAFCPGDFCTWQLPASTHGHFLRFNTADPRSVLDISNVLDKTWQEDLQFQLKQNAVFQLITFFWFGFVQKITNNEKTSDWKYRQAWEPKESIVGSIFILVYTTNVPNTLKKDLRKVRDKAKTWKTVFNLNSATQTHIIAFQNILRVQLL